MERGLLTWTLSDILGACKRYFCHFCDLRSGTTNSPVHFTYRCIVAGLSLLSSSVMRLKPASPSEISSSMDGGDRMSDVAKNGSKETRKSFENFGHVDLFLPPLSLYVLTGVSRYRYTHSLLSSGGFSVGTNETDDEQNKCRKIEVDRKDRISVVIRDAKSLI